MVEILKFSFLIIIPGILLFTFCSSPSVSYETYRKAGGNTYVKLSRGWTNYELSGSPGASHTVVLIHGGTIPLCIWEPQMDALRGAGFRVLRYDQYGKGFSERPEAVYSRDFYVNQLKELLDTLKIIEPVDIVGPSFGGAIGVTFAARFPQRVSSLLLVSPALNVIKSSSPLAGPIKIMRNKFFGGFLYSAVIRRKMISRGRALVPGGEGSSCSNVYLNQFNCQGTDRALLSMFRSDAFEDYRELTRTAGKNVKKILLVRGKQDQEITPSMITQIREDLPGCEYLQLDNSGHSPGKDAADVFNSILIDFITGVKKEENKL